MSSTDEDIAKLVSRYLFVYLSSAVATEPLIALSVMCCRADFFEAAVDQLKKDLPKYLMKNAGKNAAVMMCN